MYIQTKLERNLHSAYIDSLNEETNEDNENIVTKLYKDLANLTLEERKEESLMEKKENDPVAAAKCPPILGGRCLLKAAPLGWREI